MGIKVSIEEQKPVVNKYLINDDGCNKYKYSDNIGPLDNRANTYGKKTVMLKVIEPYEFPGEDGDLGDLYVCEVIYILDSPRITIADEVSNDKGYNHSVCVVIGVDMSEMRDNSDYSEFVLLNLLAMEDKIYKVYKEKSDSNVVGKSYCYVVSFLKGSGGYGYKFSPEMQKEMCSFEEECTSNNHDTDLGGKRL